MEHRRSPGSRCWATKTLPTPIASITLNPRITVTKSGACVRCEPSSSPGHGRHSDQSWRSSASFGNNFSCAYSPPAFVEGLDGLLPATLELESFSIPQIADGPCRRGPSGVRTVSTSDQLPVLLTVFAPMVLAQEHPGGWCQEKSCRFKWVWSALSSSCIQSTTVEKLKYFQRKK